MAKASIKDVARRAGVSTATVSHVINKTRFVRDETRQKVLDVIEELNYQPSAIARGLATNSTLTIGVVVSDITNPFFTAMVRSIQDELNEHAYHALILNTDEDPERENDVLRLLAARQIDGLIITPTGVRSEQLIQMALANLPIVLLDRGTPGVEAPVVGVDNEEGAYEATKHLLEAGHCRIAALVGLEAITTQLDRANGYRRALQEAGISIDEALIVHADPRFYKNQPAQFAMATPPRRATNLQMTPIAFQALQQILDLSDGTTAIFVANNQMTVGALHALKERGLRCPEDISLISFDDHDWALVFSPSLTVVRQPTYRLGLAAAKLLMKLINGEAIEQPSPLPVELIIRESVKQL